MSGEEPYNRRRFLAALTATTAAGLAGCEEDIDIPVGTVTNGGGDGGTPVGQSTPTSSESPARTAGATPTTAASVETVPLSRPEWEILSGEWRFEDDRVEQIDSSTGNVMFVRNVDLQDGSFAAEINSIDGQEGAHLVWRGDGGAATNYYRFGPVGLGDPEAASLHWDLVDGGEFPGDIRSVSTGEAPVNVGTDEFHDYRVEFEGTTHRLFVDDELVFEATHDAHTENGRIGFHVGSNAAVRNVRYSQDPRAMRPTTPTVDPESFPPARVPMSEVPREIRRRAARLVEDARGTPVTWSEDATLGEFAHPVERPDVEGVAYYELAVDPAGFVVCATDKHDAPIPHWNSDDPPLGVQLERRAGDGVELGRLVWIDPLRYVAEDPDGRMVAGWGNRVPKIEGLEALVEADEDGPRRVRYGSPESVSDVPDGEVDEGYEPERLLAENDRDPPEEFSFEEWDSHEALLDGYEEAYGPLLDDLAEQASEAWAAAEESAALAVGATHREPVLDGQTVESVEGAAAEHVDVEHQSRESGHDVLALTPLVEAAVGDTVSLLLNDGERRETLDFRVEADESADAGRIDWVGDGTDGNADAAAGNAEPGAVSADVDAAAVAQQSTSWAGGFDIQPKYHQYTYQGCMVGCGPVAWALLFGWGDMQADGGQFNGTWNPRYGLYLEDGGRGGSDAVAPESLNSGIRNVIEEINGYVDTFCVNATSAASPPWWMEEASRYFAGRTHADMQVEHGWSGRPVRRCRIEARDSIRGDAVGKGQTPVIVGKGWMSHYPMAYAYREAGWLGTDHVKVNNAWGGFDRTGADAIEWIWAKSWFSGEIYP